MRPRLRVLVIGGGISGLTAAHSLTRAAAALPAPLDLFVLEESDRVGGFLRTDRAEGYVSERGPSGFLSEAAPTLDLVRELGIEDALLPAHENARKRYIYRSGRLRAIPTSPKHFLGSDVLSPLGRLRVLLESLVPPSRVDHGEDDESVLDFATRRIGKEAAAVLVDSIVSGIYAGDASELEVRSAFPKLRSMELEYGGLFRALRAKRAAARRSGGDGKRIVASSSGPGGRLTSFREGMETLIAALARDLGDRIRTGVRIRQVRAGGARGAGEYWVWTENDPGPMPEGFEVSPGTIAADAVVLAVPAHRADDLLREMHPPLARSLLEIPHAGLAVVATGYRANEIRRALDGFGFLVPRRERLRSLGTIWVSSIFPSHAPPDTVFLRTMVGGSLDPGAVDLRDDQLLDLVSRELDVTMDLRAAPIFARVYRHPRAIPQYTRGHGSRLRGIHDELRRFPGLALTGNAYRGIGVNDCIREAREAARGLVEFLAKKSASSDVSAAA